MSPKICVIGGGIIGTTCAICIQERIPSAEIAIMAAEFSPDVTSDVAAGHIEPYLLPEEDPKKINEWCLQTMIHCRDFMKEHPNGGVQEASGYFFQNQEDDLPFWAASMPNFRQLTSEEISEKHPLPQKIGFFFSTFYIEPTKYISRQMNKFTERGGKVVRRLLKELSDVGEEWDLIVNCSGLGAKDLFGDDALFPVRGQIMRVRAPYVKHFFADDDFYVLMNDDCLILGGTAERGESDLTINEETAKRIFEGNCRNIPSLKDAAVLSHHVGLRPCRPKVRLEVETASINGKMTKVVHNYGHGGSGITLSWGTALKTAKMVEEELGKSRL